MKKNFTASFLLLSVSLMAQTQELNGVTFGLGAGFNQLGSSIYSYSLTTDDAHALKAQELSKTSFVISSILSVKLGKLKTPEKSNMLLKASGVGKPNFEERLAFNVGLNLLEINADNVSFNKNIDGGLGIGYYLNAFTQFAVFYDLVRIRQLRGHVKDAYLDKSIPNGSEIFNALDEKNNELFYNKTFTGWSFKVIFSLGSKKAS